MVLPEDEVRALMEAGEARSTSSARGRVRRRRGRSRSTPRSSHRLLNGLDDIGVTLQQADAIDAYERERERAGPVTTSL